VMTPKSLLRHPMSVSSMDDLAKGRFQPLIHDTEQLDKQKVRRLVFCSGKVYFDLAQARAKEKMADVALIRIEQLYPFPRADYEAALAMFPNAKEVCWCQEEPENQGAWYQIKHRLQTYLQPHQQMFYATRPGMATTAGGYLKVHNKEQEELVREALAGGKPVKGG